MALKWGFIVLNLKQWKQWKRAGYLSPKRFKLSPSVGKVMTVALWDSHGIILAHFMPKDRTVTARFHSEVIVKESEASPEIRLSFTWQCPTLTYYLIYSRNSFKRQLLSHPSNSPDLARPDFYLLPELKKNETREALISACKSVPQR